MTNVPALQALQMKKYLPNILLCDRPGAGVLAALLRCLPLRFAAVAAAALLFAGGANAQNDAQFTQYFEVPSYYNAGAIGTSDLLRIRAGARLQWVGIHGAPKTFMGTADMPFKLFRKRFGVGLVIQQESLGLYKNMNIGAQVAYKQKLFKGVLSIGAQIGFVDRLVFLLRLGIGQIDVYRHERAVLRDDFTHPVLICKLQTVLGEEEGDLGADLRAVAFLDRILGAAVTLPVYRLSVLLVGEGVDVYLIGYHEYRVEAESEVTDDLIVRRFILIFI